MKQNAKKGYKNQIGAFGEQIAVNFLSKKKFKILATNYLKKWGEIDIVAHGTNCIHFVEVKTVSYETKHELNRSVAHGTWRPEENVSVKKIQKMHRAIETWLLENKQYSEWQIDIIAVRLVPNEKYATVKYIPNIIM